MAAVERPIIEKIEFQNLSFTHPGHDPILENCSFEFPLNSICWIKAETGVGRSTLFQLISALQMPNSGNYLLNGQIVNDMSFEEFLPYRLSIGYGFDYGGLINNRTLVENLMLPLQYHKVLPYLEAKNRVERYMIQLGILKYAGLRPAMVQGAVRKITCLIRALVLHPQILLLDDPTVGLSPEVAAQFFEIIVDLRKKKQIRHVFITSLDVGWMNKISTIQIHLAESTLNFNRKEKVVGL